MKRMLLFSLAGCLIACAPDGALRPAARVDGDRFTAAALPANPSWRTAGSQASDWINVSDLGYRYPWLVRGDWTALTGSGVMLEQSAMNGAWYGGAPPLSFMRYNGAFFGPAQNGLPSRYHVQATMRVLACDWRDPYAPIGDSGVQVFFLDPTHYCEVVYRPATFEVWQCNGGQPFNFAGWTLLARIPHRAAQQEALVIAADVDTNTRTLSVTLPDAGRETLHAYLLSGQPHWVTLRASNAEIQYSSVSITAR